MVRAGQRRVLDLHQAGREDRAMALREEVAAVPLFAELGDRHVASLAALARACRFTAGQVVFAEGDPASGFHVVTAGRVRVFKSSPEGREQILHVWGPGEPFGEVAVFHGDAFPASVAALDDSRTLFFPRAGLLDLVRRDPEFALRLLGVLALRLRRFAAQVEALTLREVPARLAAYLLLRDDEQGGTGLVELDLAKGQLANLLGATPETFSRVLGRLAREGLVRPEGARAVRLLDAQALGDVADGRRRL
jgi:CRP/FNR family transcriptional regulator